MTLTSTKRKLFIGLLLAIVLFVGFNLAIHLLPQTQIQVITSNYVSAISFGKPPSAHWEKTGPGILRFDGTWEGDGSSTRELKGLLTEPINLVRITNSGGGEVGEAMADAELLLPYKPRVVVEEFCASSCANYLLPIAGKIEVRANAIIAYHGTACEVGPTLTQCTTEQAFWKKLPSGNLVSKLPTGLRHITLPPHTQGWMPTEADFAANGYPPVVFDWYPKPYTTLSHQIYTAPLTAPLN
jgi:hypothetical protein